MRYRRAFANRFRTLSIAGLEELGVASLPLPEIYVERNISGVRESPNGAPLPSLGEVACDARMRLVLEGRAGSGKSAVVRYLALACAAAISGEPQPAAALVANWPAPLPAPVFLDFHDPNVRFDFAGDPWSLVETQLERHDLAAYAAIVRQSLHNGEALVIADGLTRDAFPLLGRLVSAFPANRFILAGRVCDEQFLRTHGFQRARLVDLDRERIDDLASRFMVSLSRRRPTPDGLPPLNERIADLQSRLQPDDGLRELTVDPLALVFAIQADISGITLPSGRAEVYRRLVDTLWRYDTAPVACLEPLALALHTLAIDTGHPGALPYATTLAYLRAGAPAVDDAMVATLLDCALDCGLLETALDSQDGAALYSMPRAALRAFLAGSALARSADFAARVAAYAGDLAWREALTCALWQRERIAGDAMPVARLLLTMDAPPSGAQWGHARGQQPLPACNPILLAAAWVESLGANRRDAELLALAQQRLQAVMTDPRIAARDRVQAGMALGRLGDPRLVERTPPLARIDAGVFVFGANIPGYDDEGPAQRIDLPAYQIGVYPITNLEYGRFLAANPAYPRPRYWYDPRFNGPSQPVVGVSWFNAMAYAEWLSQVLAAAGALPPGMTVRLPLENEWEKATTWGPRARRPRVFPWGDHWENDMANVAEARTGPDGRAHWATTPVGCFPGGVSQYGVHDLIGNVWEWTASEYSSRAGGAGATPQRPSYVLRGSSFNSNDANARATYRGSHLPPEYWRYNIGFRIVIARPLAQRPVVE